MILYLQLSAGGNGLELCSIIVSDVEVPGTEDFVGVFVRCVELLQLLLLV